MRWSSNWFFGLPQPLLLRVTFPCPMVTAVVSHFADNMLCCRTAATSPPFVVHTVVAASSAVTAVNLGGSQRLYRHSHSG